MCVKIVRRTSSKVNTPTLQLFHCVSGQSSLCSVSSVNLIKLTIHKCQTNSNRFNVRSNGVCSP